MGFFDSFYELVEAATPWSDVQAEAVSGDSGEEKTPAAKDGGEAEVCIRFYFISTSYAVLAGKSGMEK